jgi:hypothetical protein
MRAKSKLVVFALSAMMIMTFTIAAYAQTTTNFWFVSSTPTNVVQTGVAEVLGEVRITAANAPYVQQPSVDSTISVTYNVPIANAFSGQASDNGAGVLNSGVTTEGITITVAGNFADAGLKAQVSNNPANGSGTITISVPAGLTPSTDALIKINGVRGRVTGITAPATVNANLTANPSFSHSFVNVSTVIVAYPQPGLVVTYSGAVDPICQPVNPATIHIGEGFAGAFVQEQSIASYANPANPRPGYGATNHTQIRIMVQNLPANVTIVWPVLVAADQENSTATLNLLSGSTSTQAIYDFQTLNQGNSDLITESFSLVLHSPKTTSGITVPSNSGFGQATASTELFPKDSETDTPFVSPWDTLAEFRPSFEGPVISGNLLAVTKCVTYLLWPYLAASSPENGGFDSGVAVANTSADGDMTAGPFVDVSDGAAAQSGQIVFYGWPMFPVGTTPPTAPLTYTVPNLEAGNTWADSFSDTSTGGLGTVFGNFIGYVIARADFQYAHGFGFITAKYGSAVPVLAQGYIANVIPDPSITGGRNADPANVDGSGENLGN